MNFKLLLPWLCVVGLVIGLAALYSSNQKQAADLGKANQELEQAHAAMEEAKKAPTESAELIQLRKENQDVLRLRNEVNQLRGEKQRLSKQAATAEAQAQNAQAQVQTVQAQVQNAQAQIQAQAQRIAAQAVSGAAAQAAACINNLRQIDGAKQQWALENKKAAEDFPAANDLAPYFKGNALPMCPAGGVYTINAVAVQATCSIPGHVLPK